MQIGEVGAPAARNSDLLPYLGSTLEQQHPASALVRSGRAHEAGCAGTDDDDVKISHYCRLLRACRAPSCSAEDLGAGIRAGFSDRAVSRIELSRPDGLIGPVGVGFPLFNLLPGSGLCPCTRSRFGHVITAFPVELY